MRRRTVFGWISACLCALVGGCWYRDDEDVVPTYTSRPERPSPPTLLDPVERVAERMQSAVAGDGVSFDPITLSILASLICSVIRYCAAQSALKLQASVQRRPNGAAAVRLRGRLRIHYAAASTDRPGGVELLFPQAKGVEEHVDATMAAFIKATPVELAELLRDLKNAPPVATGFFPTLRVSDTAADWSAIE